MTDSERKKFAEEYLLLLSEGINPLNNEELSQDDIVNNPHISNCLKFAAGVIAASIEAEEKERKRLFKKTDFQISDEKLKAFSFSKRPLSITELSKRLNELIDTENMKRFSYSNITSYLVDNGFLQIITASDGKNQKLPTNSGKSIGIFTEERTSTRGPYTAVLYDENAQRFIIDNFEAIFEYSLRKKEEKHVTEAAPILPWTEAQDMSLRQMMKSGSSISQISMLLKRSEKEIHERIKFLRENSDSLPEERQGEYIDFNFAEDGYKGIKKMGINGTRYIKDEEEMLMPDIDVPEYEE